jgi:hypothetical protein
MADKTGYFVSGNVVLNIYIYTYIYRFNKIDT